MKDLENIQQQIVSITNEQTTIMVRLVDIRAELKQLQKEENILLQKYFPPERIRKLGIKDLHDAYEKEMKIKEKADKQLASLSHEDMLRVMKELGE